MKTYYTLVTNEDGAGWAPQFGDYDREVVEAEQDDYCDGGIPRRCTRIIKSGDRQADIQAKVDELNGKRP
jgi:hypothetical protein